MDKNYLTAPCGLDCFNCSAYEENITDEYKQRVAELFKVTPEKTVCKGCRGENGKCLWSNGDCATWNCIHQKGGISFCYECVEFPCGLLAPTAKGADFPHNMKVYNLCRMKLNGFDAWAEESLCIRKRYYDGDFIVGKGPIIKDK